MQATQRKIEYRPAPPPKKRIVKMEGNVAYISSGVSKKNAFRDESTGYSEEHNPRSNKSCAKQKVNKPAAAEARHIRTSVASTIIVIFVAFCALALLVSRFAAVCSINSENNKLKSEINAIEVKAEELKVQMELQDDLEKVLDTAVNDLGMAYPDQNQRVYLDMS